MERLFSAPAPGQDRFLRQLQSGLVENEGAIDRVCVHLVFIGDPAEAERSQALDKLQEDLENKRYLIDQRFGRLVTMVREFRPARTRRVGPTTDLRRTHTYPVQLGDTARRIGPQGETMTLGSIRLVDLGAMHREMGQRFFERNIRAALPEDEVVNRSIHQSLRPIAIEGREDARVFAFNHNGVTLSAEALSEEDARFQIAEPRLLNGARTVTTFARFLKASEGDQRLAEHRKALESIRVMCRIITEAQPAFVTAVTINNNRQNPVDPWHLHANDMIQLELQDKLRTELGVYYERQERAFENLCGEELEEQGIREHKAVELSKLARTFLVIEGEIHKLARFREVFEDDQI
jgi:hypothetical protein